jgi:ribosomal protein S27AE
MEQLRARMFCEKCGIETGEDIELKEVDTAHPDGGFPQMTEDADMEYQIWRCPRCKNGIMLGLYRTSDKSPQSSFR